MNRRDFVGTCVAAGALVALGPSPLLAVAGGQAAQATQSFRREHFEAVLHSRFRIRTGPWRGVDVQLAAVEDGPATQGVEQFALLFRGREAAGGLPPETYGITHSSLGDFDLYLEPSAEASGYRATFGLLA